MRLRRGSDSAAPGRRPRRPAAGGGNGNEQKKQKNTSESSRSSRRRKTSCSPLARRLVRILSSPTAGSMSSAITLDRSGDSRAAAAPSTSASVPQAIKAPPVDLSGLVVIKEEPREDPAEALRQRKMARLVGTSRPTAGFIVRAPSSSPGIGISRDSKKPLTVVYPTGDKNRTTFLKELLTKPELQPVTSQQSVVLTSPPQPSTTPPPLDPECNLLKLAEVSQMLKYSPPRVLEPTTTTGNIKDLLKNVILKDYPENRGKGALQQNAITGKLEIEVGRQVMICLPHLTEEFLVDISIRHTDPDWFSAPVVLPGQRDRPPAEAVVFRVDSLDALIFKDQIGHVNVRCRLGPSGVGIRFLCTSRDSDTGKNERARSWAIRVATTEEPISSTEIKLQVFKVLRDPTRRSKQSKRRRWEAGEEKRTKIELYEHPLEEVEEYFALERELVKRMPREVLKYEIQCKRKLLVENRVNYEM